MISFDISIIKSNLNSLEEVRKTFPIFSKFESGEISSTSIMKSGLHDFVNLIRLQERFKVYELDLFYDSVPIEKIKSILISLTTNEFCKNILVNKSPEKILEIFTTPSLYSRYSNRKNKSYCDGIEKFLPVLISYLSANNISTCLNREICPYVYSTKIEIPKIHKIELENTSNFIDLLIKYAKSSDFNFRASNYNIVINEIPDKIRPLFLIESGLLVKCIKEKDGFTVDKIYRVDRSSINYSGYLEISLIDDLGNYRTLNYANSFEEISKKRDDILAAIGLDEL